MDLGSVSENKGFSLEIRNYDESKIGKEGAVQDAWGAVVSNQSLKFPLRLPEGIILIKDGAILIKLLALDFFSNPL